MSLQLKLWTRAGACALLGLSTAAPVLAQEGGEGGDGGEGGGEAGGTVPSQYRLMLDAASDP